MNALDLAGIPVDTATPVLVTGATGYVAGWIVKGLLDAGVTVHAAVRDPEGSRVAHLINLADKAPGILRLFASDLLKVGSYAEAMEGVGIVIHTASPFLRSIADPQRDLVDPAVKGTQNVLRTACATQSVRKVVLTSSIAAMFGDAKDLLTAPHVIDENRWNTTSSLTREPYNYSKTLAEKVAWEIADTQDQWTLATINPGLVIGPALNAQPTSESFTIVRQLIDGTTRWGAPRLELAVVDVRDVAYAHIAAAYLKAMERYLVVAETIDLVDLGQLLIPAYGNTYHLPKRGIPKPLMVLAAPLLGQSRGFMERNIGYPLRVDTSKSRRELGVRYMPIQRSLEEMVAQF